MQDKGEWIPRTRFDNKTAEPFANALGRKTCKDLVCAVKDSSKRPHTRTKLPQHKSLIHEMDHSPRKLKWIELPARGSSKNSSTPDAEFVFQPRDTDWDKIKDGIMFDVPNCELGHHGEDVSFNSILKKYKLTDPALVLLAKLFAQQTRTHAIHIQQEKACAGLPVASARSA